MCHGQGCRYIRDGRPPTFNRNPYNGYINPYYWVDYRATCRADKISILELALVFKGDMGTFTSLSWI